MHPARAQGVRLPLPILTISLASCAPSEPPPARAVAGVRSEQTPAARKAAIRRRLAALCPTPLSDDELEWAAQFVEENRSKGAVWITGRLLKMHRETKNMPGSINHVNDEEEKIEEALMRRRFDEWTFRGVTFLFPIVLAMAGWALTLETRISEI